jgi:hypothetical protein
VKAKVKLEGEKCRTKGTLFIHRPKVLWDKANREKENSEKNDGRNKEVVNF